MLDDIAVGKLLARAQREVDEGLLPSCQLALGLDGEIVVNEVFGDTTPDTRYVIFSATKAVVAGAAWQLIGSGELDVSRPVADYIPEFGTNGKDVVTVEQVMLHTGGFPRAPLGPPDWANREDRLAAFSRWRLNWEPGTRSEYHPTSAHWVLAELIERLTGNDYRDVVNERIAGALGLQKLRLGPPPAEQGDIASLALCGSEPTPDELMAALGVSELPVTEVTDDALISFNDPAVRAVGVPGGGGVSTAHDLALYYQALLHNTGDIWKPDVLADVTSHVRNRLVDILYRAPANRSLGLILAGDDGFSAVRGMGRTVSPGTFGHNGAGGQLAWADPATGLSFVYLTNGLDRNIIRLGRRGTALGSLAALCATPLSP
jgi:CubicO group peptidase (beta-lactamase class C family)